MSNPSSLGSITYEVESSWGEDVDTTSTFRLPHLGRVDVSKIMQDKHAPERVQQTLQGGDGWILGTHGGEFDIETYLTGHGASTTGAGSVSSYETYLGKVIGNVSSYVAGTTLTGGTANIPTTTASGTHLAGGLTFIGALGDGDGDGQAYAIATHTAQNLTLLTDLRGAPVNGAAMSGGTMLYPPESPTSTAITGCRFLLQTANLQVLCHGCFPKSYVVTQLNPGDRPRIRVTWGISWFEYKASTFPSTVSTDTSNPGPNAAGSLWVNTVGTTTNASGASCRTYRNFEFTCAIQVYPQEGPGGVNQYQKIVGARRGPSSYKVAWTEDADAATTSPVLPGYGTSTNKKHALLTLSTGDGSRVAMYWPNLCVSTVPNQIDNNGLNGIRIDYEAYSGSTTTNDLTMSAWRMLFA